jgi:uncharacterized protein (UPF0332 family)
MVNLNRIDLAKHRLIRAKDFFKEADILFEKGCYKGSNNRAYYAAFDSIRALLALEAIDFKKHSAVIGYFNKNYIKTAKLPIELSAIINNASEIRNVSDYDDFFIASKQETYLQINNCKKLYTVIKDYLKLDI